MKVVGVGLWVMDSGGERRLSACLPVGRLSVYPGNRERGDTPDLLLLPGDDAKFCHMDKVIMKKLH